MYDSGTKPTVLRDEDSDVPEYFLSLSKSPVKKPKVKKERKEKKRPKENKRRPKPARLNTELSMYSTNYKPDSRYKISLVDLHKKSSEKHSHHTSKLPDFYSSNHNVQTARKEKREYFKADVDECVDETAVPLHQINNTMQSKNIQSREVEIVKMEPKGADTSIIGSTSSNIDDLEYIPPPEVEVDQYRDAFRNAQMGPHSKSFISFNPNIKREVEEKRKQKINNQGYEGSFIRKKPSDYKFKQRKEQKTAIKSSRKHKVIKEPKSGMMLPKRVETYEDVIKRLHFSKHSNR